jgi:geranylgeranyl reductase family protein
MIHASQKITYDCDVIIVGGGPAGSCLACHLANAGISTIVLEAKQFPRDKVCGDGVSPIALRELHAIGITDTDDFRQANEITEVGLFTNGEKVFVELEKPDDLPYHARIIPRIRLDAMICETAKRAGAIYYENCRATDYSVTTGRVVVKYKSNNEERKLTSRLIVGADGSRSLVGRKLRGDLPDPAFQLLGLRAYYEGVNGPRNRVDIYFSEENFPGIYWLFPKGEKGANVGMAMVFKTFPQQASEVRKCFANHIANNADLKDRLGAAKATEKIQGWPINFYDSRNPLTNDRVMLVGEAAGLINPLSGDGIQYAVLSARWAAETIAESFSQHDFSVPALASYRRRIEKELSFDFALSNLLVQFSRNKTMTPLWMLILKMLISLAKDDARFAAILAGIFEGTYPSYKALDPETLLKIVFHAGMEAQAYVLKGLTQPGHLTSNGASIVAMAGSMLRELSKNPKIYAGWLLDLAGNSVNVAAHAAKEYSKIRV